MNLTELAQSKGLSICTAESITSGGLLAELTRTPGASKVVLGGMVVYQDQIKSQLLGVSKSLIESQSAVDPEVAAQMALSALAKFARAAGLEADSILSIATTGVAGPEAVAEKTPGTVYFAIANGESVSVYQESFVGDRESVTKQSIAKGVALLREHLERI